MSLFENGLFSFAVIKKIRFDAQIAEDAMPNFPASEAGRYSRPEVDCTISFSIREHLTP